jgi:bifunctional enzyme CysN/CysC
MGSVVYGVDADIHGHSGSKTRIEHIRRMAEIANIFIDAGVLLIITAVDITSADLNLFHTILDPTSILTVWVGSNAGGNNSYDIHLKQKASAEETVASIVLALQEDGFLPEEK